MSNNDFQGCGCASLVFEGLMDIAIFIWILGHFYDFSIGALWNDLLNNPIYIGVIILAIMLRIGIMIYLVMK